MPSTAIVNRSVRRRFEPGATLPSIEYGDWFVLRTHSRQEKLLAAILGANGIGYCLLLVQTEVCHGPRRLQVAMPLFPGFLFLRGSIEDTYFASRTRRIAQVITVPDQPGLDLELASLSKVLSTHVRVQPVRYVKEATRAVVRSGPLRGIQGFLEDPARLHRLILPIEALGQAIRLDVDSAIVQLMKD